MNGLNNSDSLWSTNPRSQVHEAYEMHEDGQNLIIEGAREGGVSTTTLERQSEQNGSREIRMTQTYEIKSVPAAHVDLEGQKRVKDAEMGW